MRTTVTDPLQDIFGVEGALRFQERPEPRVIRRGLIRASDFAAKPPAEPQWLVENLILQGANGWIGAGAKVGKSYLALDLLLACALGEKWLGEFAIPRRLIVVLIEEEDSAWRVYQRLKRLCAGRGVDFPDTLYLAIRRGLRLDDTDDLEIFLEEELEPLKPDMIVWDVFNRLHTSDEGRRDQMMPILRTLDSIRNRLGCSNLVAHHSRKPSTSGPDLASGGQRLRGLSEFWGWAENSLYLSRHKNSVIVEPESKDAIVEPFTVHLDDLPEEPDARRWVYDGEAAAKLSAAERTRQKIVTVLQAGGQMDKDAIAAQAAVAPRTVQHYLRDLIRDGVVDTPDQKYGRGQRRLYWLTTTPEQTTTGDEVPF